MEAVFYIASAVAILATVLTITRMNAIHALLNLIVSLLAVAIVFYSIGAPFVAALEVIIYAGAIMVLFVFVVMMLNLGERGLAMERQWWTPGMWIGPASLSAVLLAELVFILVQGGMAQTLSGAIEPKQVGIALFGPYLLGVELASMLLLAGMVGAYRIGVRKAGAAEVKYDTSTDERRAAPSRDFIHAGVGRTDRTP